MRIEYRQSRWRNAREFLEPLIFELRDEEPTEIPPLGEIPGEVRRKHISIPNLSEPEVVRHYVRLSKMNYGIDDGPYWLGSCTMKYNPKICEAVASWDEVKWMHPDQPIDTVQGCLKLMYELSSLLRMITDLDRFSFQPMAGAHGEYTGCLIIRKYHEDRGEERDEIIIPDSAHGTNFASAAMAGFKVIRIPAYKDGTIDIDALESAISNKTAGMMVTNPNTLGIYEDKLDVISDMIHEAGGLMYYDGANFNALIGRVSLKKMGIDIAHLNLHKTFATPHGAGGPGAGAIGVVEKLYEYLPIPVVEYDGKKYYLRYDLPRTVGKVSGYYGNFSVLVKAYLYLLMLGWEGLKTVSGISVLNSNYAYVKASQIEGLEPIYGENKIRKHEFVLSSAKLFKEKGIRARDIAKRLMDYGYHPPTVYFPPIVKEALMFEPTETENKREIDGYIEALKRIVNEDPEILKNAPYNTAIGRLDEARAVKDMILSWKMMKRRSSPGRIRNRR